MQWFERALGLGDIEAHFEIAKLYYRQKKNIAKTIEHLKPVAIAEPRVDVTEWSRDVAKRFLRMLERDQTKRN
jgi:hypothetical protein